MWTKDSIFYIPDWCRGIGDHLQFTRLPEFYTEEFKQPMKLIVKDKYDIWAHDPNVERPLLKYLKPAITIDLWENNLKQLPGSPCFRQLSKFVKKPIYHDIKPRLYIDLIDKSKEDKFIAVCTQGSNRTQKNWARYIPEYLIEYWSHMSSYKLVQIGGKDDYKIKRAIDKTGLSIRDTAEVLSQCQYFVGPNSGMMHLANCVPWVDCLIYVEADIERPICNNNLEENPTAEWLYNSNRFFSYKEGFKNVMGPKDMENILCA